METKQLFNSYDGAYGYFNKELFKGELKKCILNFSRKSPKTLGFFSPNRWESLYDSNEKAHEISINPDNMRILDHDKNNVLKKIFSTLVHEMCHLWQNDFSVFPNNGYHNKEWAEKMEEVGLMASNTGLPGGKKVGTSMSHYIIKDGPFEMAYNNMPEEFRLPFLGITFSYVDKDNKKITIPSSTYVCECCDFKLKGKIGLNIICGICQNKLKGIVRT